MRRHSSLADTAGMEHDLRIIGRNLGTLDPEVRDELTAVEVSYYSFTDSTCTEVDTRAPYSGVLIVHRCAVVEVKAIFNAMLQDTFPIAKVVPINRYGLNADSTGWNDEASMADNNTSAFNYRSKPGGWQLSKHAQGIAIDINPLQNPLTRERASGTEVVPPSGLYDPSRPGTLDLDNTRRYLKGTGWSWGGRWPRPQDRQHIEKNGGPCSK